MPSHGLRTAFKEGGSNGICKAKEMYTSHKHATKVTPTMTHRLCSITTLHNDSASIGHWTDTKPLLHECLLCGTGIDNVLRVVLVRHAQIQVVCTKRDLERNNGRAEVLQVAARVPRIQKSVREDNVRVSVSDDLLVDHAGRR